MTLYEWVALPHISQCRKHDLHPDEDAYFEHQLNRLSRLEFLAALSSALEDRLDELKYELRSELNNGANK
jgi:hypothetical protein